MLNRQLSSSSSKKCKGNVKEKQDSWTQRSPFRDLNNGFRRSNSSTSSISSSVSVEPPKGCLRFLLSNPSSSKTPILHKSRKTSKSAPNAKTKFSNHSLSRSSKPSDENHLPKPKPGKKKMEPRGLYQRQSNNKKQQPSSGILANPDKLVSNPPSGSEEFGKKLKGSKWESTNFDNAGQCSEHLNTNDVDKCTPVGKLACGSVLGCANYDDSNTLVEQSSSSTNTTPPAEASVSPEILCGSSALDSTSTKTPSTCYGAGHVISGVSDKRKCRPKGILTVGVGLDSSGNMKSNVADSYDSCGQYIRILTNSRSSLVPLPVEASVSWHLSPCHEEDGCEKIESADNLCQKGNSEGYATLDLPNLPLSSDEVASSLYDSDNCIGSVNQDTTPIATKTRITLLSPKRLLDFKGFSESPFEKVGDYQSLSSPIGTPCKAVLLQERRKHRHNSSGEKSPISVGSLSSGNVMQTPNSESSSERHHFPYWLDMEGCPKHHQETAMESLAEVIRMQNLSPNSRQSFGDPLGLTSRFSNLSTPSNSVDLNSIDNHDSWMSDSALGSVPQSHMRISWREGLVSRIFEMDDLDCCRCLSDEENDANESSKNELKVHQELNFDRQIYRSSIDDFRSPEFTDHEPSIGVKGKEKTSPERPNSCAESICTDGGGLAASGDSDWTLCYKNHLFNL